MTKTPVLIATALLAFSLTACAADSTSSGGGSAEAAISAAKSASDAANKMGAGWRDTGKMIKKAEELAKAGKTEEAIKLAKTAEMHSKAAQEQAASQKNAGPLF